MMKNVFFLLFLVGFFLASCAGPGTSASGSELTPYGSTPTVQIEQPAVSATATALPTPSPTPQYHTVQSGETMSSIALIYGLNMGDVVSANPDIDPNAMVVGMQILIPPAMQSTGGVIYSTTPEPVVLGEPECYREKSGGLWCFMLASNEKNTAVENVLVEITIGDENATQLTAQVAAAPLNMIPANSQLPLSAYFPPPVPDPYRYSYQLVSALAVEDTDRYIQTEILSQTISLSEDGITARVSTRVFANGIVGETVQVWISATALDEAGKIVGVRRIEGLATLDETGVVEINGYVYSVGNPIETVKLTGEAVYVQ